MARSKWKLNYFSKHIWRKFFFYKFFYKRPKTRFVYSRSSQIPNFFLNKFVRIHKGNFSNFLLIDNYNIGYKFGEFSFTRKPFHFPLKKKKK